MIVRAHSGHSVLSDAVRLAALRRSGLLDTAPEPSFDRLARFAARLLRVPVALVSLVDGERQFFKSQCGLPEPWASRRETPLSHSFCQHVVSTREPLVISDAREHPLVESNLAIRDLRVVAYAGVPLRSPDGQVLGSFCAIDSEPRTWSTDDVELLQDIAASVETEIRLRIEAADRRASEELFRVLVEQSPDVIVRLDLDLRHTYVSPAIHQSGIAPEVFLGRTHVEVAAEFGIPEPFASEWTRALTLVRETREDTRMEFTIPHPAHPQRWECRISPVLGPDGEMQGLLSIGRDITPIVQAEQAARQSETRFCQMAESIRDVFWITDVELTEMLYISPAYEEVWGRSCEALRREPRLWLEAIHEEDRERVVAAAVKGRENGFDLDYRIVRPDGEVRWIHDRGFRVLDAAGQVFRMAGIAEDITARKGAEAELHRRDAILAGVSEFAQQLLRAERWQADLPGVLRTLGEATLASRVYFFEREVGPADRPRFWQRCEWVRPGISPQIDNPELQGFSFAEYGLDAWERALEAGEPVMVSLDALDEAQRTHFEAQGILGLTLVPVFVAGRWSGVLGFDECERERHWSLAEREALRAAASTLGAAIERQRTDEALQRSEERFREAAEAVPQVIWMFDPDVTRTLYLSPSYEAVWGLPLETGYREPRSFLRCVHPDDRDALIETLERLKAVSAHTPEYRIVRPDGTERWVKTCGAPIRDSAGEVQRIVGITEDITERKELEMQLLHAQKMEAVGRLAGGVAHDFNNMLQAISGFAAFLEGEVEEGTDAEEFVHEIQKAASRAADMTRQLLAFGRKQVLQPRLIEINEVVRDAQSLLRRLIPESVEMEIQLDPAAGMTRVDPTQMHQVLLNLGVNARDAMPDGGRLVIRTSRVEATRLRRGEAAILGNDECVRLEVQDTGIGMDPQTLARIFEPFFTSKAPGEGTGLGLSTVEGIVRQSGGLIRAHSEPGRGSTFVILLPRASEPARSADAGQAPAGASGSGTVLLVEDEDAVRRIAGHVLRRAGYSVLEASDGEDALRRYEEQGANADLLVTDVVMPRMGGRALVAALRERQPGLPAILMSGYTGGGLEADGWDSSDVTFLQKPFQPAALASAVSALLRQS